MKRPSWRTAVTTVLVAASLLVAVPRAAAAPPGPATLLGPQGGGHSNPVQFSFTQVAGSTWYYLWVKNLGTGATAIKKWYDATKIMCLTGFCFIQSPVTLPIGDYRWWVQTWNADGDGPWSSPLNFTIAPLPKPTINQPAEGQTTPYESISWGKVSGADQYQVWINQAGTGTNVWKKWYTLTEASCADALTFNCGVYTPLPAGGYKAWVRGWNSSGNGLWSDSRSFTFIVPPAATLVSPSGSIADTTPTYTWEAANGATWYYLWVSKGGTAVIKKWYEAADLRGGGTDCVPGSAPCSATPATTLTAGSYTWWIQTWSSAGYGPWSAPMNFTVS